jgi:hypothetical protein
MEMTFALPWLAKEEGVGKSLAFLPSKFAVVATSSAIVDLALNLQTSFLI